MKGKKFAGLQGLFHNVALPGEPRKKAGRREIAKELCAGADAALVRQPPFRLNPP